MDSCGVCDSDSTNDCIQDCSGEWGGTMFDCGGGCDENIDLWGEGYNIESTGTLQLSNSGLEGEIPPEIGQLRVWYLDLSDNNLSGEIPIELISMESLTSLDLTNNQLSGEISPEFLEAIEQSNITILVLEENHLSGQIPEDIC